VAELDSLGMEIGSHGKYHLRLDQANDRKTLESEIIDSKKIIEQHLAKEIYTFTSPFGINNQEIVKVVKEAGYKSARSIINGVSQTQSNLYSLRGYFVTNSFSRFIRIVDR
jgi:peptidoglycan/xylan/chitin deacetylase (PgdA/CDA1 family)